MLLNGILKIALGISGIIITIIWFNKSTKKLDINTTEILNMTKDYSSNISEVTNPTADGKNTLDNKYRPMMHNFPVAEIESTILLDLLQKDNQTQETELLEEDAK